VRVTNSTSKVSRNRVEVVLAWRGDESNFMVRRMTIDVN
jgi:hypothetical protein